jgi:arginyl-tRNA synthetase
VVDPAKDLSASVRAAAVAAFADTALGVDPAVHRSDHADYQADMALALARRLKRNPREVASAIIAHLDPANAVGEALVSGPGFINFTCRGEYLDRQLERMRSDERLGIRAAGAPATVVIDYSSPNLAKAMHVGHLRSTIIGDSLARTLEYLGHRVIRQNHIGDWGTPFGMLIEEMLDEGSASGRQDIVELSAFYRAARSKFDADPAFAERARMRVVLLQRGDPATLELWQRLIELTSGYIGALYARLHVRLAPTDIAGESRYNLLLPGIVADLERTGLARDSERAVCVFPPGFAGRDGAPLPLIIRKQDGGFGYAATDLAALRYRLNELGARRVLYVVGAPQSQHFAMVFATAHLAGWVPDGAQLEHVAFGSVLGEDASVLKTRAGEAVTLAALIDEAVNRARRIVDEGSPSLPEIERARIAESVGVGSVKYADLANDRIRDYVFSWARMLSFDGNTAPYLMYAHARIRSIGRKAGAVSAASAHPAAPILIQAPAERALALELLQFPSTVVNVGETLQPHRLCQQLFRIASAFSGFYDNCPVLQAEPATRASRLALCELTARVLACGLELLGIDAPESM